MTTLIKFITLTIVSVILLTSCTDVIDVEVQEADPRLVIEASLNWEKGTLGNNQTIKLSTSTPYFDEQTNTPVTTATVKVTNNDDGSEFVFAHQTNGSYTTNSFVPVANNNYTLEVIYNGESYVASETLIPVVDIADVYQSIEQGNDEALEVNIDFNDPLDEENYYFVKIKEGADLLPTLFDVSDEFVDGNLVNLFHERLEDEDINQIEYETGDNLNVEFYGISEPYYEYIGLLISQYESAGDIFSTTPVALRGNCVNPANPDNYAYGYFRLTEVVKTSYTFQ